MTEPLSDERLAEIRAGLVGCTPGPWMLGIETSEHVDESEEDRQPEVYVCSSDTCCDCTVVATMGRAEAIGHDRKSRDASHIARLDPQTVAALLSRLDKAEAGWRAANMRFLIADKAAVTAMERLSKAEAAIAGILSDWDARGFGRQERYIAPDPDLAGDFGYWSPDARMVGSEHIAKARSCLPPSP